jgi:hypothetical protein
VVGKEVSALRLNPWLQLWIFMIILVLANDLLVIQRDHQVSLLSNHLDKGSALLLWMVRGRLLMNLRLAILVECDLLRLTVTCLSPLHPTI